jgi:hypothetical protein
VPPFQSQTRAEEGDVLLWRGLCNKRVIICVEKCITASVIPSAYSLSGLCFAIVFSVYVFISGV